MTYPQGFDTPGLAEQVKRHDMTRRVAFARESFSPGALEDTETAAENFIRLVGALVHGVGVRKAAPARGRVRGMTHGEREDLMGFVRELLHGNEALGFNGLAGPAGDAAGRQMAGGHCAALFTITRILTSSSSPPP